MSMSSAVLWLKYQLKETHGRVRSEKISRKRALVNRLALNPRSREVFPLDELADPRAQHSFPTRRSSDLLLAMASQLPGRIRRPPARHRLETALPPTLAL